MQGQGDGKACEWTTSRLPDTVVSPSDGRSLVPPGHISPRAEERGAKLEPHSALYFNRMTSASRDLAVFELHHQTVRVSSSAVLLLVLLL